MLKPLRTFEAGRVRVCVFDGPLGVTTAFEQTLRAFLEQQRQAGMREGVVVPGGATPREAYRRLASPPAQAAEGAYVILSDDRLVPLDSPQSNLRDLLPAIERAGLPPDRLLCVDTAFPAAEAADLYDRKLRAFVDASCCRKLAFLGMGPDGHTAALFNQAALEAGAERFAIAVKRPDGLDGVSITPRFLAHTHRVVFVVSGEAKRDIVGQFLTDPSSTIAGRASADAREVELWLDPAALGSVESACQA